ncbi:MAG: RluA family pseudouridine synthase [Clostridiales bacterium]|jgi:23S rRNA pseudouridine1911/1915/1917 synthase|nr:RluA family pseudouridine synthase [Clostridiales bacterium]
MTNDIIFEIDFDDGHRIDVFLAENLTNVSRSFVKKRIDSGDITVNNMRVKVNYRIKEGDIISVSPFTLSAPDIKAEDLKLDILYEDKDIVVVDKPKHMVVHPAAGHYTGTLVNALLYHCQGSLSGINGALRPGIVHRIDMDTSGVLVAAKNDNAHRFLSGQFAEHSITRVYEAVTINVINKDTLDINKPIGRCQNDRKKMCVTEKNSKNAVTHIRVVERFLKNTFVEARLETGRTHQIRVHLSHLGYPLVGDVVYGPKKQNIMSEGQALFARTLGFIHPSTKEYVEFSAKRPEYFEKLLRSL